MPKKPKSEKIKEVIKNNRNKRVAPSKGETDIEKEWNFYVYIAGENNLAWFVDVNCEQMTRVGSTKNINILCSVDRFAGGPLYRAEIHQPTRGSHSYESGIKQVWRTTDQPAEEQATNPRKFHSGTDVSLKSFLRWGIKHYPARKHCLVLWNHGCGILDPSGWGRLIEDFHTNFFKTDPATGKVSVTREDEECFDPELGPTRGIGFNDSRGTFIDNQGLSRVLEEVRAEKWGNKRGLSSGKFDIIGMDACCMANIEIATQLKQHADFLVFSQEVELGPGWNYESTLKEASRRPLSPLDFCYEMVKSYEKEYTGVTHEFTMATVDLTHRQRDGAHTFTLLEDKVSQLATVLTDVLKNSPNKLAARRKIMHVRNKPHLCTSFYSDKYVDLRKFLRSLNTAMQTTLDHHTDQENRIAIQRLTAEIVSLIGQAVPFFTAGSYYKSSPKLEDQKNGTAKGDYSTARGLSIYFPTRDIHRSYRKTLFAQNTEWLSFLEVLLKRR